MGAVVAGRLMCVAGARPNFMKIKPVLDALEARGLDVDLVHTGQHYDPVMSDVFFADLGLRQPDVHLGVSSGTQAEQTAQLLVAFEALLVDRRPQAVVVVGDVNSSLAAALTAAKAGALVAHVEAGLRSRDWSMPEEVNRVVIDRISDLLFAPSADAVENLQAEGYRDEQVHLVGNVMIDTLLLNLDRARERDVASDLGLGEGAYGLVTLHRPGNVDDPVVLTTLLAALSQVARRIPLVFPVHPRTRRRLEAVAVPAGIRLIEPLGYLDFLSLQASAAVVLTDSGGLQEETTALGVPCLTLRQNTERPITVSEGTNRLVGLDPVKIIAAVDEVLSHGVPARCPSLWDGKAGLRIVEVVVRTMGLVDWGRPTEENREFEPSR